MPEINPVRLHSPAPRRSDPHAPMPWAERGLCTQTDPDLFFPEKATASYTTIDGDRMSHAKAICGRCPVRPECLTWALDNHEEGIWGGTTTDERSRMRGASA
jgi:WhiB family redox-sensing transcriptional regulator